jgi:hypothetical protein
MAAIDSISTKGVYTLSTLDSNSENIEVKGTAISTEDELAAGDIIVYALIDGVYYTNLAEVVTATIDKNGVSYKNATITAGDDTYEQSGIAPTTEADQKSFNDVFAYDTFEFDITDAVAEKTYDLYLDNYGYVRAYTLNKYTYGLGLLTDAYFGTDNRTDVAKVTMVTADAESADYDVTTAVTTDWTTFINNAEGDDNKLGNRGTWLRLNGFQKGEETETTGLYNFKTNIASYVDNDGVLSLYAPEENNRVTNKNVTVIKEELDLSKDSKLSTRKLATKVSLTAKAGTTAKTVYATTDTVYYYVVEDVTKESGYAVTSWVGYENAPSGISFDGTKDHAYTVATESKKNGYYNADVIVIEAKSALSNVYFNYAVNAKTVIQGANGLAIGYSAADEAYVSGVTASVDADSTLSLLDFYTISTKGAASIIKSNFNANGIYATTVENSTDIYNRNYIYLTDNTSFKTGSVEVYKITYNKNGNDSSKYGVETTTVKKDDMVIYFKTAAGIQYLIDVTQSVDDNGILAALYNDTNGLYDLIVAEQTKVDDTVPTLTDLTVKGTDVAIGPDNKGSIELSATAAADLTTDHLAFTVSPADTTSVVVYAGTNAVAMNAVNTTTGAVAPTNDKKAISAAETLTIVLVNGTKSKTYTVDVTVAAKKQVATIDTLKVKGVAATLDPDHADTFNVTVTPAKNAGSDPQVEVTTTDVNAKVTTLTNGTNTPLSATTIALGDKASTATGKMAADSGTFTIEVTAEDGTTKKEYTVNVTVSKPVVTYTNADGNAETTNTSTVSGTYNSYTYTATITPKAGYVLKSVTVNGGSNKVTNADTQKSVALSESITADTTIVVVTEAITYKVEFTALTTSNQTIVVSSNDLSKTDAVTFDLYNTTSGADVQIGVTDSSASLAAGTHSYTPGASLNSGDTIKAVATINGVPYTATAIVP